MHQIAYSVSGGDTPGPTLHIVTQKEFSLHDLLITAISHQPVSCLCLLDLSAAFDTIDHSILLHRL